MTLEPNVASGPQAFLKKPVEIQAWQWSGGSTNVLDAWLGHNWTRADARDVPWEHEDEECLVVWNSAERLWLPVPVGHWIIRGVQGEFYPCKPDIFDATYEAVA